MGDETNKLDGVSEPPGSEYVDRTSPRRLSAEVLAKHYPGTSARWWQDRFGLLARAGILHKRKRSNLYFGRLSDVDDWLMGVESRERPFIKTRKTFHVKR